MTVSTIFFTDLKGNTLLTRNYRGDIPSTAAIEAFPMLLVNAQQKSTSVPPCLHHNGISYMFVTHNDVYVLGLSKQNSDAASVLFFLQKIVDTLTEYFKQVSEETIRDNFVLIYELLDEMMDFGHPQISDYKVLQEYITQDSHPATAEASSIVTSSVSWRPEGIYYKKNELFLDVIESVEFLLNSTGNIIRNEVHGKVQVNAYLSGMPRLKLGLNDIDKKLIEQEKQSNPDGIDVDPLAPKFTDKALSAAQKRQRRKIGGKQVHLQDIKFHQCVELDQFENDRTITFIPPDGKFELLTYRVEDVYSKPLFSINATVDLKGRSRVIINVTAKSQFRRRSTASLVEIAIPVPPDADSPRFKTTAGSVIYAPEMNAVVWKLKDFPGGQEYSMKAQVQLSSISSEMEEEQDDLVTSGATTVDSTTAFRNATINRIKNQPISVKFEIPYFALSGLQVRYLKVDEPRLQYQAMPWVRYMTKSGQEFSIRMPPKNVF